MPQCSRIPVLVGLLAISIAGNSDASRVIVPDEVPTIQQALDLPSDTVIVRPGAYHEVVVIHGKGVILGDAAPGETLPEVDGFILPANESSYTRVISRLHVSQSVHVDGAEGGTWLESCVLGGGLTYSTRNDGNHWLSVRNCTVPTGLQVASWGGAVVVANHVFGPLEVSAQGGNVVVSDNRVEGAAAGIRVWEFDGSNPVIERNTLTGGNVGLVVECAGSPRVASNRLRNTATGIVVKALSAHTPPASVEDNDVIAAAGIGIDVSAENVEVRGNVVGRCSGDGLRVASWRMLVERNTSYLNGGRGFIFTHDDRITFQRNIAYGNAGRGAEAIRSFDDKSLFELGCNDYFANGSNVGWSGDQSVDPAFCDLANDDVSLRADSPLLDATCGVVGAEGMGCDVTTEVLVSHLEVEQTVRGVRIRWRLGGDESPVTTWIERSEDEQGPWQRIATERARDGDATIEMDLGARADRDYWYRLAWIAASGEAHSPAVEVAGSRQVTAFGLRMIGPNPTQGPVTIEYSLPRTGPVQLTVHDVMGREVARLASGVQEGGRHMTRWTGEYRGGQARAGVYFVRLRQAGEEQSRRLFLRK